MVDRSHSLEAILKKRSKVIKLIFIEKKKKNYQANFEKSTFGCENVNKGSNNSQVLWTINKVKYHDVNGRPCMISCNHTLVSFHLSRSLKVKCHDANWMATWPQLCYQIASDQRLMRHSYAKLEKKVYFNFKLWECEAPKIYLFLNLKGISAIKHLK